MGPKGAEDVSEFETSSYSMPSRYAKLSMKAASAEGFYGEKSRQSKVWADVDAIHQKLSKKLDKEVKAQESPSSLQLSMEDETLDKEQERYTGALSSSVGQETDVIGYVFAINGELNSADVYPDHGLFIKLWPKLLNASVVEAIGEQGEKTRSTPVQDDVVMFLKDAETGTSNSKTLTKDIDLEIRDSADAVYFETRYNKDKWVHRNYLVKDKQ